MIKIIKKYSIGIILGLIFILGLSVRLFNLNNNPLGFFCDEASVGYNAYSLLTTGKDEWGESWPLFFKAFGEYKSPVMIYSTIPFVYLFGLSEFSVRLVSVIYGCLTIIALYFLAKGLFNSKVALLSSFFLAIVPWHIHFSRVSLEGLAPFVFFVVLGSHFWIKYLKQNKNYGYLSVALFIAATYSYFPARIFVPLYGLTLIIIYWAQVKKNYKNSIQLFIFLLILITPLIIHMFLGNGLSRWNQVKGDFNSEILVKKYFDYFSVNYLFFNGDINSPGQFITRHSIKGMGELYLFQLPLIIVGIIWLIKNKWNKKYSIIFFWLLFFPFCDLFTNSNSPQATRTIIGVIPFQILSALGIYYLLINQQEKIKQLILAIFIFLLMAISFSKFEKLYSNYPQYSSDFWGWQYGPKEIVKAFISNQNNYDQLCMEAKFNEPQIFFKFYDPTNICQNKCQVCGLDTYSAEINQLFAISSESYDKLKSTGRSHNIRYEILYPNQKVAFVLIDFNNK